MTSDEQPRAPRGRGRLLLGGRGAVLGGRLRRRPSHAPAEKPSDPLHTVTLCLISVTHNLIARWPPPPRRGPCRPPRSRGSLLGPRPAGRRPVGCHQLLRGGAPDRQPELSHHSGLERRDAHSGGRRAPAPNRPLLAARRRHPRRVITYRRGTRRRRRPNELCRRQGRIGGYGARVRGHRAAPQRD